jgi:ketosteroid isomerase-like protein
MSPTASDLGGFFEALNERRFDRIEERVAEDVVFEFPGSRFGGRYEGRRRFLVFLRQNQRLFRDGLRFTPRWIGVVGDHGVVEWTNRGVTRDGREYANRGVTVFRFEGGLIVEVRDHLDTELVRETWPGEGGP